MTREDAEQQAAATLPHATARPLTAAHSPMGPVLASGG